MAEIIIHEIKLYIFKFLICFDCISEFFLNINHLIDFGKTFLVSQNNIQY